jgi:hypothetical protein
MITSFYYTCCECGKVNKIVNILPNYKRLIRSAICLYCSELTIWLINETNPALVTNLPFNDLALLLAQIPSVMDEIKLAIKSLNFTSAEQLILQTTELSKFRKDFKTINEISELFSKREVQYALLGLEALSEFCFINGQTAQHFLFKDDFITNYFLYTSQNERLIYFEHLTKEIRRCFILELASTVEYIIRMLFDKYIPSSKHPLNGWDKLLLDKDHKLEIAKLSPLLKERLSIISGKFIPLRKYIDGFVSTQKYNRFLDLLFKLRNTFHNGGFYVSLSSSEKPQIIEYAGYKFEFSHKKEVMFPLGSISVFLKDTMNLFLELHEEVQKVF